MNQDVKRGAKVARAEIGIPILGEQTGKFFGQAFTLEIDGDKLPADNAQELLNELRQLLRSALKRLRDIKLIVDGTEVEWFDCEALDRRHALGRVTLLVFDYITGWTSEFWHRRKERLAQALPEHD